jgi:DNA-directed RNA polymerase specialized sigma24 family protein
MTAPTQLGSPLNRLGQTVVDGWFESRQLRSFTAKHRKILFDYIKSRAFRKCGGNEQILEDVCQEILSRLQITLGKLKLPLRKSSFAVLNGVIGFHLNKVISQELAKSGRPQRPFGITLSVFETAPSRSKLRKGVVVSQVTRNSSGESCGVKVGDELLAIGTQAVRKLSNANSTLTKQKRRGVTLTLKRGAETLEILLKPAKHGADRASKEIPVKDAAMFWDKASEQDILRVIAAKEAFQAIKNKDAKEVIRRHYIDNQPYRQIFNDEPRRFKSVNNVKQLAFRGLRELFVNLEKYAAEMIRTMEGIFSKSDIAVYQRILKEAQECQKDMKTHKV